MTRLHREMKQQRQKQSPKAAGKSSSFCYDLFSANILLFKSVFSAWFEISGGIIKKLIADIGVSSEKQQAYWDSSTIFCRAMLICSCLVIWATSISKRNFFSFLAFFLSFVVFRLLWYFDARLKNYMRREKKSNIQL